MVNRSKDFAEVLTREKRRKQQRKKRKQKTTVSDQNTSTNRGCDKRPFDGDLEKDPSAEMDPNRHAATIVGQQELQEILGEVTQGNLRQYSIFITNLCAISRYLLDNAPGLYPGVSDYVKRHIESGDALLTFILEGPHPSMIPQGRLPSFWDTGDPKIPANEPDPAKQQPAAPSLGTSMAQQQQSDTLIHPEGIEGQPNRPDHPTQVPQTSPNATAKAIQQPVLTGNTPAHQQTGQQPLQGQASSRPVALSQGIAGPNFTSYGQQPPLASITGPGSDITGPNSLPAGQVTSAAQLGQASQCNSAVQPYPAPTAHAQHPNHLVVNSGVQPGIARPSQMHAAHQLQPTAPNFAPVHSQLPALHPASTLTQASQPAGLGWSVNGLSQLPSQVTQAQSGPTISHSSIQPIAPPSGQQWPTNPVGPTQIPSQVAPSAQQGNATVLAQSVPQMQAAYGQPGPLNMLAQPSAAQSQAETAPNPLWPGQSQEGNLPENDFLSLSDLPPVLQ